MKKLLNRLLKEIKLDGVALEGFLIKEPEEAGHGHLSTNAAMVLAPKLKKNPRELAKQILAELEQKQEFNQHFGSSEIAGPGFLNFWLKDSALIEFLREFEFKGRPLKGQKILVEYAQPNPFKALHIGHLRGTIVGETLCRVLELAGAEVVRANYQGDVGLHVAKCFWGLEQNPRAKEELKNLEEKVDYLAKCYVAGNAAYEEDEKAKEEIHEINKKIYQMDKPENAEFKKQWEEKRKWSLDKFEESYARLGAKFDRLYFESEMAEPGLKRCAEAKAKGILKEDDGCLIFDGEKYDINNRVFVNKLGLPTYEGKELGLAFKEFTDWGALEKVIHVVANEQINFFKVTFLVEKLMDEKLFGDKQHHLSMGFVSLTTGKMSSRSGNVVLAEDILNAAVAEIMAVLNERSGDKAKQQIAREERDEIAEAVGIGAVTYSFLKINTMKDISFDLKESVQLEGRSGPYVMYSYVRAGNILKNAAGDGAVKAKPDFTGITELADEERDLILALTRFPEIIERAATTYQLAPLTEFAYELANAFSSFYNQCPVLNEKDQTRKIFRLQLVKVFQSVQGQLMDVMGMGRVERM